MVHLTGDYHVIPRKGEALTWESPGTTIRLAVQAGESHQEIATPVCGLARNDICYSVLLL